MHGNSDVINNQKRIVLSEKVSRKNILINYENLDADSELELVQIIAKKYSNTVFDVYRNDFQKKENARGFYSKCCTVKISTINQVPIFVELNAYSEMADLYQMYFESIQKVLGVKNEMDILVNKKNQ